MQNQIYKVLSIFKKHKVKALLIGGQAAILYGASEFSRDIDFTVLLDNRNLERIRLALDKLKAEQIYFPSLSLDFLAKGHGCHFRCGLPEIKGFRVDIIAKMRGCSNFNVLWKRRKIIKGFFGLDIDVISLQDLVQSKKTQRDKDWYMIKRLVEIDILMCRKKTTNRIKWWFRECRTPEILNELARKYPDFYRKECRNRLLLKLVNANEVEQLRRALYLEENAEREKDKAYWLPLKKELEKLRHGYSVSIPA